ncbi:S-adenosyl-L-methionine-dependent methyltransferase [Flammula alnicola]|nr:S-adenosyl-L-methionine-dependent methyltransferase [Flammula alnicola]
MSLASPSLTASYSTASSSYTGDGKRHMRRKDFQHKYGQRHHSYDKEKAPYPLSYDKHVLELEALDNRLAQYLRGSVSFANFKELPTRALDLGCGTGNWVIDAAKAWPECELVGFDLVDVQIPLRILHPSIASRIEWKHGNFLTTKLPFDDDEFDHVHIQSIATGVPENKWGVLLEEVCRVLRPGGSVEVIEDDIIFPTLPRWFTQALRARPLRSTSVRHPDGSRRGHSTMSSTSSPFSGTSKTPCHDHALLESLYRSIFENRFINLKPSCNTGTCCPFPYAAATANSTPTTQITTSYIVPEASADLLSPRASTIIPTPLILPTDHRLVLLDLALPPPHSLITETALILPSIFPYQMFNRPLVDVTTMPLQRFMLDSSLTESETDALPPGSLFPMAQLSGLSERSLAMHLYRSHQAKRSILPFGWDDDEELEELQSRKKFEKLIERYRSDMQARVSLWCSLDNIGWPLPAREPLSKAELIEEERLREA